MLSDEEKILIKKLRYCEQEYEQDGYLSVGKFEAIKEAVNLIEKQSKEIEELKKPKYVINCKTNEITKLTNDFVSKDKIKAKIEELKEDIKYSANPLSIDNSKFGIKVFKRRYKI